MEPAENASDSSIGCVSDNVVFGAVPVLHVTTERGWRGGERQALLLMTELSRRGVPQALASPARSELSRRAADAGFPVILLHPRTPLAPRNVLLVVRWLNANPPAIVHAHSSPALTLTGAVRRLAKVRGVVYTRRTAFPVRASRKYRTAADVYVAVSQAAEQCLLDAGTPQRRLHRIPDAVDPEHIRRTRGASGRRPAAAPGTTVLSVGRLSPEKGHRVLVEAWPAVLASVPDARLLIAGDGPERSRLLELIAALDLTDSVHLMGFREPIGDLLAGAAVFVMPSLEEGLGSAALEAMRMSLPVVASRAGGLPDAVEDGRTGLLVPSGEPGPLAAAVVRLLKDDGERKRMGEAGQRRARELFSPDRMAAEYLRLYRELAKEWERGAP